MPRKYAATLLLLCAAIPCLAFGSEPGTIFNKQQLNGFIAYLVFAHVLGIVAFISKIEWLRVAAGVVYAPVFFILTGLCLLNPVYALLFLFTGAFFTFTIIIRRK